MPFMHVNGQELYYEDTGGDGPPVVLSHGFLLDHGMFAPQVAELRDVYRLITWDQRGFGETRFDGRPFTLWDSARDVFSLLDTLGIERAVFGGVSQGGYVSLRGALLHPDRVRALLLLDTQAASDPSDTAAEYRRLLEGWMDAGYQEELASRLAGQLLDDPHLEPAWRTRWQRIERDGLREATHALLERDDVTDRMAELAMPVLLLHGSEDAAIPVGRAEEICAAASDCRGIVEIPGAGHTASLTHPDLVNPAIRDFLESLPA